MPLDGMLLQALDVIGLSAQSAAWCLHRRFWESSEPVPLAELRGTGLPAVLARPAQSLPSHVHLSCSQPQPWCAAARPAQLLQPLLPATCRYAYCQAGTAAKTQRA